MIIIFKIFKYIFFNNGLNDRDLIFYSLNNTLTGVYYQLIIYFLIYQINILFFKFPYFMVFLAFRVQSFMLSVE